MYFKVISDHIKINNVILRVNKQKPAFYLIMPVFSEI